MNKFFIYRWLKGGMWYRYHNMVTWENFWTQAELTEFPYQLLYKEKL